MPREGPVPLIANPESFLDPLAVAWRSRRPPLPVGRKIAFQPPAFGNFLRSVGCVPRGSEGFRPGRIRASIDLLKAYKAAARPSREWGTDSRRQILPFSPESGWC